jgi:hypothetical protein
MGDTPDNESCHRAADKRRLTLAPRGWTYLATCSKAFGRSSRWWWRRRRGGPPNWFATTRRASSIAPSKSSVLAVSAAVWTSIIGIAISMNRSPAQQIRFRQGDGSRTPLRDTLWDNGTSRTLIQGECAKIGQLRFVGTSTDAAVTRCLCSFRTGHTYIEPAFAADVPVAAVVARHAATPVGGPE